MRKNLLLLLISLFLTTLGFSQNTYPKLVNDSLIVITPEQLKSTNLIFLEHKTLKLEVIELSSQINSYEEIIKNNSLQDSLLNAKLARAEMQMSIYDEALIQQNNQIKKLTKQKKTVTGISIAGGIVLAVLLLLK